MTKSPFAGAATGPNPTDRGNRGTKRSQLSDGRGMPLAVIIDGTNRHDRKLASATLDHLKVERPLPSEEEPQHLCLDAGYDYDAVYETVRALHYEPHIRPNQHHRAPGNLQAEQLGEQVSNPLESNQEATSMGGGATAFVAQSLPTVIGVLGETWPYL